jgi:hypothetical protein
LASCITIKVPKIEEGQFIKIHDYFFLDAKVTDVDELILNKDSTFSLSFYNPVVTSKCQGKWYYMDERTIYLKCNEPYIPQDTCINCMPFDLSWITGYMRVRERKVKVVNANKIKLELPESESKKYIILKRIKE